MFYSMGDREKLPKTTHLPWPVANLEADPSLIFYSMGEQEKIPKNAQFMDVSMAMAQFPSPLVWS